MFPCRILVLIAVLFYFMYGVHCQDTTTIVSDTDDEKEEFVYDPNYSHCYRFTFLDNADNSTNFNYTCKDLKLNKEPCMSPFVITPDGTEPDLEILWKNHRNDVLCRPAKSQSCVKYTFYFNGKVTNTTYMCAKAVATNEGPVESGCYSQFVNGYEIEACMCKPKHNSVEYRPCNAAAVNKISACVMLIIVALYNFN